MYRKLVIMFCCIGQIEATAQQVLREHMCVIDPAKSILSFHTFDLSFSYINAVIFGTLSIVFKRFDLISDT